MRKLVIAHDLSLIPIHSDQAPYFAVTSYIRLNIYWQCVHTKINRWSKETFPLLNLYIDKRYFIHTLLSKLQSLVSQVSASFSRALNAGCSWTEHYDTWLDGSVTISYRMGKVTLIDVQISNRNCYISKLVWYPEHQNYV